MIPKEVQNLLDAKAEVDNTIDLNAYGNGLLDMYNILKGLDKHRYFVVITEHMLMGTPCSATLFFSKPSYINLKEVKDFAISRGLKAPVVKNVIELTKEDYEEYRRGSGDN